MNDSTYKVMPVYVVEGDEVRHMDTKIKELGIKFSFDRINYETNRPVIIASEHKEEDAPFILVKAVIFPWINLLWIGSILMALGTVIAVVQRLKRS
jgi:cytochrome c-type biogenesis protein CcmF